MHLLDDGVREGGIFDDLKLSPKSCFLPAATHSLFNDIVKKNV